MSKSEGLQLVGIGVSRGQYYVDEACERRLNSQALAAMGMRVAAVALLCGEASIWRSMLVSATPCPVLKNGQLLVGKRALVEIKANPQLWIPDWEGNEDWYTQILAGGDNVEENPTGSISDRYRTSKRSGRTGRPNIDSQAIRDSFKTGIQAIGGMWDLHESGAIANSGIVDPGIITDAKQEAYNNAVLQFKDALYTWDPNADQYFQIKLTKHQRT